MSASVLRIIPRKLVVAFGFCVLILGNSDPAQAQTAGETAVEVGNTTARLKLAVPTGEEIRVATVLGQRLLVEARYAEAYELFTALLDRVPREPSALYGAALAAFDIGRAAEAEPWARQAVQVYLAGLTGSRSEGAAAERRLPTADALVLLAVILGARGADNEALRVAEQAVATAPEHFDAQFTLARARYTVGDSAAAVIAFRAALALKPGDGRTRFFLATALEGAGKPDEALTVYRGLVVSHPQMADGHLGLGALLIKRGGADIEAGIQELRIAVRLDPNLYEAQVALGRALLARKLTDESLAHLRRAAELLPDNPEPHYQLALAYRRLGLNQEATAETAIVKRIHEIRRGGSAPNSNSSRPDPQ